MKKRHGTAIVLGLGTSGEAAASLLAGEGTRVTAVDRSSGPELAERAARLEKKGVAVALGSKELPAGDFGLCVVSPGVPAGSEWVKTLEARRIEVVSELEVGASRCRCPILAITGSNGKSTLVKLCGDALGLGGRRVELAANYGVPLCDVACRSGDLDWIVAEVSSFQLEKVKNFRPRVGVLLNINPNHLDRHGDMKTYVEMKSRLFSAMTREDTGILGPENLKVISALSKGHNRWITFGLTGEADYRYEDGKVRFDSGSGQEGMEVRGTIFANDIMGLTAAAATAAVRACGLDASLVRDAARSFRPLEHRMNHVAEINGVRFIDDSKCTNLGAMRAALAMCDAPVRLIAGGLLKESDLGGIKKALAMKARHIYLVGQAAEQMEKAWGDAVRCSCCGELEKAVRAAWKDADRGEIVLLSPGCASFDQFKSFEDRGEQFVAIVKSLKGETV